ncbi:MAG: hypothetical protein ACFFC7_02165 [Candidatus Hermodarchaeota archaeon]
MTLKKIPRQVYDEIYKLEEKICERTGTITPYILCPLEEDCTCRKIKTVNFENGKFQCAQNSAILSLKITFNDEIIDPFIFKRILTEIHRLESSKIRILKEPEEEYDITFYFDENKPDRKWLEDFLNNFQERIRITLLKGKIGFNKIIRDETAKLLS